MENLDKIAAIADLFPGCVTEIKSEDGRTRQAIDFDLLKQALSGHIVQEGQERYQFTWPGKKQAMAQADTPTDMTLLPCREESVDFDSTQNLYIEGDNLEVLKLLRKDYAGRIKMIYIDPPYNTGCKFIYKDRFTRSAQDYLRSTGQTDAQGNFLVEDPETEGRFHTDWLNMMYPRLLLARELLTEDGAIFISIDENECKNLGKIYDEIFGEQNFVECFVYDKKAAPKGVPPVNMVCGVHEYIYVYAKSYSRFAFRGIPRSTKGFSNPDNDPRGLWRNTNIKSTVSEHRFPITDPKTGNIFVDTWAFSPAELERMIREDRLIFPSRPGGQVRAKEFYAEFSRAYTPIRSSLGLYDAQWNTERLSKLMGGKFFQNAKHLKLMQQLIDWTTGTEDLVLDFFSGSATTGHAVMQLNAEDGGSRKFILVQLPEETPPRSDAYKAGYKNICEIGKERLRRAGRQVIQETGATPDIGFRVLKRSTP